MNTPNIHPDPYAMWSDEVLKPTNYLKFYSQGSEAKGIPPESWDMRDADQHADVTEAFQAGVIVQLSAQCGGWIKSSEELGVMPERCFGPAGTKIDSPPPGEGWVRALRVPVWIGPPFNVAALWEQSGVAPVQALRQINGIACSDAALHEQDPLRVLGLSPVVQYTGTVPHGQKSLLPQFLLIGWEAFPKDDPDTAPPVDDTPPPAPPTPPGRAAGPAPRYSAPLPSAPAANLTQAAPGQRQATQQQSHAAAENLRQSFPQQQPMQRPPTQRPALPLRNGNGHANGAMPAPSRMGETAASIRRARAAQLGVDRLQRETLDRQLAENPELFSEPVSGRRRLTIPSRTGG